MLSSRHLHFPDPAAACQEGLLAFGGDLRPMRLVAAYRSGIFPWYSEGEPILWWSPDPRLIFLPDDFHISRRFRRTLRERRFRVTFDTAFERVIARCAAIPRSRESGTWILPEMIAAYTRLNQLGHAHSVEVWDAEDGALFGGMYGVSVGACYCGESMFSERPNGSKIAMAAMFAWMRAHEFHFLDAQLPNRHLLSLGGRVEPRDDYLRRLNATLARPDRVGRWDFDPAWLDIY